MFSPGVLSLVMSFVGTRVLNSKLVVNEQHSHISVPFVQVVKGQCWSAIEITSSVDLLGRYANWSGSMVSGIMVFM